MEYFKFGMETMRITQNYNDKTSHYNHSHGYPFDYPIDVAGIDNGQSAYFSPVDMKVVAIRGVGNSSTNTIWLRTVDKVITPTFTDYVWLTLTHWNDSSITAKMKVGQIIKKNHIIAYEGTDGTRSNHLHLVCGRGNCSTWIKNNLGSWVMKGRSLKPEDVMYVDPKFTKIEYTNNLKFLEVPRIKYYPSCNKSFKSFVDALKSIGVDSSFSNRKEIAKINNINSYFGTYNQNIKLLNLLKNGLLISK